MKIHFIGDVHRMTDSYQKLLRQKFVGERTFQLGDMGVGFATERGRPGSPNGGLHVDIMNSGIHKWIRGNHDNPEVARRLTDRGYAGDYGYDPETKLFWVGGGYSIDRAYRTPGKTWWAEEELSYLELQRAIELYIEKKPDIVATHEAPSKAAKYLLYQLPGFRPDKLESSMSRTSEALQVMLDSHEPVEWVFGHYHVSKSFMLGRTKFSCVNQLDVYTVDTNGEPE